MKKEISLWRTSWLVGLILLVSPAYSQYVYKAATFEIGGNGGFGSFNYERQFYRPKLARYDFKVGFSLAPIDKNNGTGLVFPLGLQRRIGTKHQLVLGLGQGLTLTTKLHFFIQGTAAVMYRYQPEQKHFFFQVGYTPLFSYVIDRQWQHWAGFGFGYRFQAY